MGQLRSLERAADGRTRIPDGRRQSNWETKQHPGKARINEWRQPPIRNRFRQANVRLQAQRCGDFVLKELTKAAVLTIYPAQQITFIISDRNSMISLLRSRLPCRFLSSSNVCQAVEIGDQASINGLVQGKQSGLVGQELSNGNFFFSI